MPSTRWAGCGAVWVFLPCLSPNPKTTNRMFHDETVLDDSSSGGVYSWLFVPLFNTSASGGRDAARKISSCVLASVDQTHFLCLCWFFARERDKLCGRDDASWGHTHPPTTTTIDMSPRYYASTAYPASTYNSSRVISIMYVHSKSLIRSYSQYISCIIRYQPGLVRWVKSKLAPTLSQVYNLG